MAKVSEKKIDQRSSLTTLDSLLLAMGDVKAAVKSGQESAQRTEASLTGLSARVGTLEVDMASIKATMTTNERTRRDPWTVVAVLIAAAAVLIPVLIDAYHGAR